MAEIEITILSGVSAGDVFRFNLSETSEAGPTTFVIGRSPDCDLVLQQSEVSRKHASISLKDGGFYLTDLGSSHGTQHMGFPLRSGDEGARKLSNGDEFKVSEMLFRVNLAESPAPAKEKKTGKKEEGSDAKPKPTQKIIKLLIPVLAIVLGALYLIPTKKSGGLPAQRANEVMFVPSYQVSGNFPGAASARKEDKDQSHIDLAQFDLPSSDLIVEYEVYSEAPIEVRLDDAAVEKIEPTGDSWQYRSILVRDVASGKPRRLVFDNTDFPRKSNDKGEAGKQGPLKKWAVKNVRISVIQPSPGIANGFVNYMEASIGLAEASDKSADGLFLFVRSLQSAALQLMQEQRIDAFGFSINVFSEEVELFPDLNVVKQKLQEVLLQNSGASSPEAYREILRSVTKSIGQYDAEIWRRINNRISKARTAVKVGNSIEAHDQLKMAMNMFPPEGDFRWVLANRMYMDNKVIPKNVREHPEKFRPRD